MEINVIDVNNNIKKDKIISTHYFQKGLKRMTEYLYIAADAPLRSGLIDGRRGDQQPNEFQMETKEYFYFENNLSEDTGDFFNFSSHFPFKKTKYQVASIDSSLPSFKKRDSLSPKFKNTLKALEGYILEQFENGCNQLIILYSLNSYENEPLKETEEIYLVDLNYQDLYYREGRLLKIKK